MALPSSRAEIEAELERTGKFWPGMTSAEREKMIDEMTFLAIGLNDRVDAWNELPHDVWND